MAKFSNQTPTPRAISTVAGAGTTHEGGAGVRYDSRSELWNLSVGSMMGGESSFYEDGKVRDERMATLVKRIVSEPDGFGWLCRFVPYLRREMFMRTAPVIIAAEAAHAYLKTKSRGNAEYTTRKLVASAIGRMDEFGEFIGYWRLRFGRTIPGGVQRGLADAFTALASEYSGMKYDGIGRKYRMGDIIDIVHPTPKDSAQSALFSYFLDRRHNPHNIQASLDRLPMIKARREMDSLSKQEREEIAAHSSFGQHLKDAGMTWENVAGWLQRELTARDWENLIPTMGYMALLRNLRNFDKAGICDAAISSVCDRLADPVQVARSMQFPYRFYTAYEAANESFRWADTLSVALDLSTKNVPKLDGKTLVLVDTSGSMQCPVSQRSTIQMVDIAALFGAVMAATSGDVDVVAFANSAYKVQMPTKSNVLRNVAHMRSEVGKVGHGTNIGSAQEFLTDDVRRIVILSDMQDIAGIASTGSNHYHSYGYGNRGLVIPDGMPVYSFNLSGYATGIVDTGIPGRYLLGGFSDKAFTMMEMIEKGKDQSWPF